MSTYRSLPLRAAPLVLLLLTACTSAPPKLLSPADECAAVSELLAAAPENFSTLRSGSGGSRTLKMYTTSVQVIGNDCQIWEWANGRSNYLCRVEQSDLSAAKGQADNAIARLQQCPGMPWQVSHALKESDRNQGSSLSRTTMTPAQGQSVVTILTLETQGGLLGPSAQLYFAVGSPLELP